jgi:hypothetical protein
MVDNHTKNGRRLNYICTVYNAVVRHSHYRDPDLNFGMPYPDPYKMNADPRTRTIISPRVGST